MIAHTGHLANALIFAPLALAIAIAWWNGRHRNDS